MENLLFLGVPILKHIRVVVLSAIRLINLSQSSFKRLIFYKGRKLIQEKEVYIISKGNKLSPFEIILASLLKLSLLQNNKFISGSIS